ncbi:MAG: FGGY-family carbohydrate kinase [Paracoccaceae bacterium]
MSVAIGIDLGTSGARASVVVDGIEVAFARAAYDAPQEGEVDATSWPRAAEAAIDGLPADLRARAGALAVAGTSGTVVLTDAHLAPLTPGLMYSATGFEREAAVIEAAAPGCAQGGPGGALARALHLAGRAPEAVHLCHQAEFVSAHLAQARTPSDDTNALKLGWDPAARAWHPALDVLGLTGLLPEVRPVGARAGRVADEVADRLSLPRGAALICGATDSVAAVLATGAAAPGDAVTSLGTTLVVKIVSRRRIDDPARGVYSHRMGDLWLVGGASNAGAGVIAAELPGADLDALSARIDPARPSPHDLYPLPRAGERFPDPDPSMPPRLTPRDADDAAHLHALMEGIARIEARAYAVLAGLDAPRPTRVLTVGGGARNDAWTAIRARVLGLPVARAATSEASTGMARLAARALR